MAIDYIGKAFESASTSQVKATNMGIAAKAGSLIVIGIGAQTGSGTISLSSVTDTKGNVWQGVSHPGPSLAVLTWTRTSVAMTTSDIITRTLNKAASSCWMTCHVFEKADDDRIDDSASSATTTGVYATPTVSGSDWLALALAYWSTTEQMTTTEVDSSVSRDDAGAGVPYAEFWSKNGSTGSVQIGATISASRSRKLVAVTLPFLALPGSGGRGTRSWWNM